MGAKQCARYFICECKRNKNGTYDVKFRQLIESLELIITVVVGHDVVVIALLLASFI